MDEDLLLLPKAVQTGESSYSQTLQDQILPETNDSFDLDGRCVIHAIKAEIYRSKAGTELRDPFERETIALEHGKLAWKDEEEFKLARALTIVTLDGFQNIFWNMWKTKFHEYSKAFDSFRFEVFDAMARFVWNLYDEEDFENIAFNDDMLNECERIWKLVCEKGDFELDSSLPDVSNKYERVREQDVCSMLEWYNKHKSLNNDKPKQDSSTNFMSYVKRSRDAMLSSDNLDPKGIAKQQLRMDLNSGGECFCVVDALCMQAWKYMNFQTLEAMEYELKGLVVRIHNEFYRLAVKRMAWLCYCGCRVTYPLSAGNIFGSWDSEVLEVVRQADLKRRSEGRRFIGTDHLVFSLHQMLVSDNAHANVKKVKKKNKKGSAHAKKNSIVWMPSDYEGKHKDTVYHLYRQVYKIATKLGHESIGLGHLYVAITSSANDDKSSWKVSVERVERVKNKRKCKCEELHPNLWKGIIGEKGLDWDKIIDVVKNIKDESNIPLQRAISGVLYNDVDKRTHRMSEGEMISSLKKI